MKQYQSFHYFRNKYIYVKCYFIKKMRVIDQINSSIVPMISSQFHVVHWTL